MHGFPTYYIVQITLIHKYTSSNRFMKISGFTVYIKIIIQSSVRIEGCNCYHSKTHYHNILDNILIFIF